MPSLVSMQVIAHIVTSGTTYTVDGQRLVAVGEVPLADLSSYARGSVIVGGATDWEPHVAKTDGAILIGDGADIASTTTPTFTDVVTFPNTGLHILDTGGDHDLIIKPGTDVSVDRTLTLTTGDADRTITLSGNPTLADWFDQSVKVAASPTFAAVSLATTATFTGATGVNTIIVPDNFADALSIEDAGGITYVQIVSTNTQPVLWINPGAVDVDFHVAASGAANAFFVQGSDGFVGAGTNVPSAPLHEKRDQNAVTQFRVENLTSDTAARTQIVLASGGASGVIDVYSAGYTTAGLAIADMLRISAASDCSAGISLTTAHASAPIRFWTASVLRVTIESGGNVGINEATPGAQHHIQTSGTAVIGQIVRGFANQATNLLELQESDTSIFLASGDGLGGSVFAGNVQLEDIDFVWAGATEANLFHIDAALDATHLGDWDTNYTAFAIDGGLTQTGTARINWTKITADSVTLSVGGTASAVADLRIAHDGNLYHIDEAGGVAPSITFIVDFVSVTAFNWAQIIAEYDGSATHSVCIELWNWDTSAWDGFDAQNGIETALTDHSFFVPDDTDYIGTGGDVGEVRVRFNHPANGNGAHDLEIDVVALYQ